MSKLPFNSIKYDLFEKVVLFNTPPKKLTKKYNLTESQIRKIVHKDSTVTEEQYNKWVGIENE